MYGYGYKYTSGLVVGSGAPTPPPFANTKSLLFDGTDDYLDCGNDSSINISGDLTLSAWVFIPLSAPTFYGIFSKIDASTRNYEMLIRNNQQISFYTNTGFTTSTSTIPLNTWTHVMVTVESGVAGGVKFYFNGVLDATTGTQTVVAQTHNLSIGRRSTGSFYLNGNIDEPCIFNRVVTPSEIVTLSTAPTVDLTSLNPIAWYRNGDNGSWKSPQWLIPNNENKDKVSNYSFDFDGVDDYVDCGDITALDNVTSATWSIWAKSDITSSYHYLMSCYSLGFKQYFFQQYTTKLLVYISQSSGTLRLCNQINFSFTAGVWYHIAIVYDESEVSNADKVKVYIDGVLQLNTLAGFALTSMSTSQGNSTEIAKVGGVTTKQYNGALDEVAIFNNAQPISNLWDGSGQPIDVSGVSGIINYWKMGDNSTFLTNWTVPDEVGSNDGTSANMTIEDRIGEAPSSENNAVSLNMDEVDRTTDVPT